MRGILIPVRIDDAKLPLGFRSLQHEELREWDGDPEHRRAKSLLKSIERVTGVTPMTQPASLEEEKSKDQSPSFQRFIANLEALPIETPISYLGNLNEQVETTSTLSYEDQITLFRDIKRAMQDDNVADDAMILLAKFRKRHDLLAAIAEEVDSLIDYETMDSGPIDSSVTRIIFHSDLRAPREVITNAADGYELLVIPSGSFSMGSPEGEEGRDNNEEPIHIVQVPAFYMGRNPVTNAQYQKFLESNPDMHEPEFWSDREYN